MEKDERLEEKSKRKRVRKRKHLSEEEKEIKREQKKERKTKEISSSSSSSSSSSLVPAEARALVNDCTVYIEGLPFESNEDAVREFFKDIKAGAIVR